MTLLTTETCCPMFQSQRKKIKTLENYYQTIPCRIINKTFDKRSRYSKLFSFMIDPSSNVPVILNYFLSWSILCQIFPLFSTIFFHDRSFVKFSRYSQLLFFHDPIVKFSRYAQLFSFTTFMVKHKLLLYYY